jgi:hypothetical protein
MTLTETRPVAIGHEIAVPLDRAGLDDLIEAVRGLVYAGGVSTAEAVREVLATMTPDGETADRLIVSGLTLAVNQALSEDRTIADDDGETLAARFTSRGLHGKARLNDILARLSLEGADGMQRVILDFTAADCVRFREISGAYVKGWTKRRNAMAQAARLLAEHKVERVGLLPADDLAAVRKSVREAWS